MKKILIINGPNLNMLGIREPAVYGSRTYKDLCGYIRDYAKKIGVKVDFFRFPLEEPFTANVSAGEKDKLFISRLADKFHRHGKFFQP